FTCQRELLATDTGRQEPDEENGNPEEDRLVAMLGAPAAEPRGDHARALTFERRVHRDLRFDVTNVMTTSPYGRLLSGLETRQTPGVVRVPASSRSISWPPRAGRA